jgi:hypothetical protein
MFWVFITDNRGLLLKYFHLWLILLKLVRSMWYKLGTIKETHMKTLKTLLLLLVTASLLSSCYVQGQGRGPRHHRHHDDHRGY